MVRNEDFLPIVDQDRVADLQGELEAPEGELYLRFFVGSGMEFALPATGIKEVLEYAPDRINPMPNVSPLLLGTVNIRTIDGKTSTLKPGEEILASGKAQTRAGGSSKWWIWVFVAVGAAAVVLIAATQSNNNDTPVVSPLR